MLTIQSAFRLNTALEVYVSDCADTSKQEL